MKIVDISGEQTVNSNRDIEDCFLQRRHSDANAFWFSHDGEEYPMLSVLVRDKIAALTFLEVESEPGYRSIGDLPFVDLRGATVFAISENRADDLAVQNDSLVSSSSALDAVKEFAASKCRPNCIQWEAL